VVLVMITVFFVLVNAQNAYAQTITITPNSVTQGSNFQVSGSGFLPGDHFTVLVSTAGCTGIALGFVSTYDESGSVGPITFSSSSLTVGVHCVTIYLHPSSDGSATTLFTVTAAPPIPEYPLGLPLLAVLTILAYSLIRRRTRN
jgi:hypothetical protein